MKFKIDLRETVNSNAAKYFEKSKKLKGKVDGINETIVKYEKEKKDLLSKEEKFLEDSIKTQDMKQRKKEWFEKFHWFYTSKGHLCVGGRDASSNEVLIKKHTDKEDLVFHTDMAGSPFFVLKGGSKDKTELEEVATVTACYSRAWKKGLSSTEVVYVNSNQVSKEAKSGEYLSKGSFMITGKTNSVNSKMELLIGVEENGRVIIGPTVKNGFMIIQGTEKTSDVAKRIKSKLGNGLLDDFVKVIPAGGCKIKNIYKA